MTSNEHKWIKGSEYFRDGFNNLQVLLFDKVALCQSRWDFFRKKAYFVIYTHLFTHLFTYTYAHDKLLFFYLLIDSPFHPQ